jgi:hypothetical protein
MKIYSPFDTLRSQGKYLEDSNEINYHYCNTRIGPCHNFSNYLLPLIFFANLSYTFLNLHPSF